MDQVSRSLLAAGGGAAAANTDPDFENVTLLLPGNGTNGAQNNTFLATAPFAENMPGGFAVSFDGNSDWLQIAHNTSLDFSGVDFTLEMWVSFNRLPTSWQNGMTLISKGDDQGDGWSVWFGPDGTAPGGYSVTINSLGTGILSAQFATTPTVNTWYHIAFSRTGTAAVAFINGAQAGTATGNSWPDSSTLDVRIGRMQRNDYPYWTDGYISNLRLVRGTGLYSANFAVPSAPLTAISGTSLLTCRSATIVDNSSNNFTITVNGNSAVVTPASLRLTITRNGNPTQGTFSPYGDNWSNFFPTGTNFLSCAHTNSFWNDSSFTMEGWFLALTASGSLTALISSWTDSNFGSGSWQFAINSNNAFEMNNGSSPNTNQGGWLAGTTNVRDGRFHHFALTKSGTEYRLFVDGRLEAYRNNSFTTGANNNPILVGYQGAGTFEPDARRFNGYASNIRLVRNQVVSQYQTASTATGTQVFSPPTAPLTAVTGTSLLICQGNRFRDASSSNTAITISGSPSVQRFSPFAPTDAYSAATIGGSGYFDGSGDYLTQLSGTIGNFGTGDFTVELWINTNSTATLNILDFRGTTGAGDAFRLAFGSAGINPNKIIAGWGATDNLLVSTSDAVIGAWTHVAVTRSGTTARLFINGTQQASVTSSTNIPDAGLIVGSYRGTTAYYNGYLSNVRIVKGTAVYTSAFSPPASPVTAITNTSLLLNFTSAGIIDNAMMNHLETVGNAQISTSVTRYGTGSLAFDGNGDVLVAASSPFFDLSSGDFTIEFWFNTNTLTPVGSVAPGFACIVGRQNWNGSSGAGWGVWQNYQTIEFIAVTPSTITRFVTGNVITATGTWYHVAVVRSGTAANNIRTYINGVQQAQGTLTITNSGQPLTVGGTSPTYGWDGNYFLNGYIDDLRITRGVARYTANFTPPGAPLPTN